MLRSGGQSGFTLVETLLSIVIIGIIAGMTIPVYQSFQNLNDLNIATNILANAYRRAQVQAQAMADDSSWGVMVTSSAITVFRGSSYAARVTSSDETYDISSSINISGKNEIVFNKFSGLPSSTSTDIFLDFNNQTSTISINSKGMISY